MEIVTVAFRESRDSVSILEICSDLFVWGLLSVGPTDTKGCAVWWKREADMA